MTNAAGTATAEPNSARAKTPESALTWMTSDDYQAIAKHRNAGSTVNSILVKAL
ncbi:DUF1330 domain-containing protein [Porticoccaceae bacterium]|nr:DUF1330 domain-containing protein [Porticoccaceae bacterium]